MKVDFYYAFFFLKEIRLILFYSLSDVIAEKGLMKSKPQHTEVWQ